MKVGYHIILHLLGLGCVAACIAIVGTLGALDIHWVGWFAVAFLGLLAVGIVVGWFPWRGKPLRVLLKGFYAMSALALIGFGFPKDDPLRPQWWMVLATLAAAILVRIVLKVVFHLRDDMEDEPAPTPRTKPTSAGDSFFN